MAEVSKEKSAARLTSLKKVAAADRSAARLDALRKCAERNFVKVSEEHSALRRVALMKSAKVYTDKGTALGALLGAGTGLAYNAMSDEHDNKRAYMRRALIGALIGGAAGVVKDNGGIPLSTSVDGIDDIRRAISNAGSGIHDGLMYVGGGSDPTYTGSVARSLSRIAGVLAHTKK